jgi:hypothetical protein
MALLGCAVVLFALVVLTMALNGWRASPVGQLSWRDQHWFWSAWGDVPIRGLNVLLDFQWLVLVVLRGPNDERLWLWLESAAGNSNWLKLRRALAVALEPQQTTTI